MKRTSMVAVSMALLIVAAAPAITQASRDPITTATETASGPFLVEGASDGLDGVRAITAQYSWLPNALEDGFVPFSLEGTDIPTCFDNDAGGMGVHYVRNVDDVVDPMDPEALVYELAADGSVRLVGVEYVVPQEFVEDADGEVVALPEAHGQHYHKHSSLPLYILHAWIWDENPDGTFADFNPNVASCPTA